MWFTNKRAGLIEELGKVVELLGKLTPETPFDEIIDAQKAYRSYNNMLDDKGVTYYDELRIRKTPEQRGLIDRAILSTGKYTLRRFSPRSKYCKDIGAWERVPKGQQLVDVEQLAARKKRNAERKPEEIDRRQSFIHRQTRNVR